MKHHPHASACPPITPLLVHLSHDVWQAISTTRKEKDALTTEGRISLHFKELLGKKFKNMDLPHKAKQQLDKSNAYVFLPERMGSGSGTKVTLAQLQEPEKTRFMFYEGTEKGSLFDLVHQKCDPPTGFPNTEANVWEPRSDGGGIGKCTRSGKVGGGKV